MVDEQLGYSYLVDLYGRFIDTWIIWRTVGAHQLEVWPTRIKTLLHDFQQPEEAKLGL